MNEVDRIRAEYARRADRVPADFYSLSVPANLFTYQQKNRHVLRLLRAEGFSVLAGKKILDIGCGEGQFLLDMESWGAKRADLAGIDLIENRIARAMNRFGQPGVG